MSGINNKFKAAASLSTFLFLVLGAIAPEEAGAFGAAPAKEPTQAPKPTPTPPKPTPPPVVQNPPTVPELPSNFEVFSEVSATVGDLVDSYYPNQRELLAHRKNDGTAVNTCVGALGDRDTFADQIAYSVYLGTKSQVSELSYLGGAYSLPTSQSGFQPASLISNPLCPVTQASLQATIKGRTIPSAATIAKANQFSQNVNELRSQAIAGDRNSLVALTKLWTKFMMCLSYQESLSSADSAASYRAAQSQGISKPEGVEYYLDPLQSPESRLNIGLFQFTPASGGNIQACIRAWNKKFPSCSINTKESLNGMIPIVGSSRQTFNAFCGVTKIVDMFSVQVNTRSLASVHPDNVNGSNILPGPNRCVTPFFHSNKSYNHFGPLQNTVNNNLDRLLTCTLK